MAQLPTIVSAASALPEGAATADALFDPPIEPAQSFLYPGLVGSAWSDLPEPVKDVHFSGRSVVREGTFTLQWWRFSERSNVPARLEITGNHDRECWSRRIGTWELESHQTARGGRLAERFGLMLLLFRLRATSDGLRYSLEGCRLRLGRFEMPLPLVLAPRVSATEARHDQGVAISVTVSGPLVGRVLHYQGVLVA